jgi:plasmid stabilization system protein ParE
LCDLIAEEPFVGQVVRPGIRRRLLRRFPYALLYSLDGDELLIVAVAHQSRQPGYWTTRS